MESLGLRSVFRKVAVVFACAAVLAVSGTLLATDFEDPIEPPPHGASITAFGGVEVLPTDVGGVSIDAKEAVEPQMSVLLLTGTVNVSPGMTVEVQTSPTFQSWVSGGTQ